ncbi:MAG: DUF4190 domain-containing protein [Leifsonia sp.]
MTDVNEPQGAPSGGASDADRPVDLPPAVPTSAPNGEAAPAFAPPPAPAQAPVLSQQPAYGQTYAAPNTAKWNVLAIISFATSLLGISLVGIVLGHIALSQIKKTGEQGKVFAIIGLVLGYLGILAAIIFLVIFLPLIFLAASNGSVSGY